MNPETRRARLKKLIDERYEGVQAVAARAIGMPSQWVSDALAGRNSFGERAARKIEGNIGLPPGWLDKAAGRAPGPEMLEIVVDGEVVATVPATSAISLRLKRP